MKVEQSCCTVALCNANYACHAFEILHTQLRNIQCHMTNLKLWHGMSLLKEAVQQYKSST